MSCEDAGEPLPLSPEAQTEKHLRHNYMAQSIEGGLFMGASGLLNAATLLPWMVQRMDAWPWIVPLMSIMMAVGFQLPPIFVAHWLDRLTRMHRLCCITGVVQRLPYLIAGGLLVYAAMMCPAFGLPPVAGAAPVAPTTETMLALWAVILAPLISGVAGGVSNGAWQQLFIRTIPARRRSSVMAVRYAISSGIALAGGFAVLFVLATWPGLTGFGILHLIAFVLMAGSWGFFATIREPRGIPPSHPTDTRLAQNLRALPAILRREKMLTRYLPVAAMMNGIYVMIPYMAIYAKDMLHEADSFIGNLLIPQMLGAILGNLAAGWLGDRRGGQFVLRTGHGLYIVLAVAAAMAGSDMAFYGVFFLFGAASNFQQVGSYTLLFELAPPNQRSTCLAAVSLVGLAGMLAYTGLGYLVWTLTDHSFGWLAAVTAGVVALALLAQNLVRDPRGDAFKSAA